MVSPVFLNILYETLTFIGSPVSLPSILQLLPVFLAIHDCAHII